MTDKLENFITIPRKIAQDRRSGLLSRPEYDVYMWTRHNANPYGIAIVSLSDIKNDIFDGRVSENYVNKLLISLKSKRYIYYKKRAGRRGSFEVHFGDWILPDKKIKQLDYLFNPKEVRTKDTTLTPNLSEPSQNEEGVSQSFNDLKIQASSIAFEKSINKKVRASYNDTDTHNENDTNRMQSFSLKNGDIKPEYFKPESHEQERCRSIARALGEESMKYILGIMHKVGFHIIERAWGIYEEERLGKSIENKGAYFNSIIKRLTDDSSKIL